MADREFEDTLGGLFRAPVAGAEPQRLIEPIMDRVAHDVHRRQTVLGAFSVGGGLVSAALLFEAVRNGLPKFQFWPATEQISVAGYALPVTIAALAVAVVIMGGGGAAWRLSREL